MHSWCTLGAHLVNSLPLYIYHPFTLLSPYQSLNPYLFYLYLPINPFIYFTSISIISIPPSSLSLSPHLSLYLFYLYLHTYTSIYSISISTSITLSILSLSPHLSLNLSYLYLHIYHFVHSISTSIPQSFLSIVSFIILAIPPIMTPMYLSIFFASAESRFGFI